MTDHDDTEALARVILAERIQARELPNPYLDDADLLDAMRPRAAAILASDWLAAYVASKVEPIEQERDEARRRSSGIALAQAEQCALDEHRQRLAADRRVEQAERERDEAQEERDYHHARADVLLTKVSGRVALRGGKPGDYWREWHLSHCGAAQAAATAERERDEAQDVLSKSIAAYPAEKRRAVDAALAEVERRIELRACITGTDRHLDIVRAYRAEVRHG